MTACLRTREASEYIGITASTLEKMRGSGTGPLFVRATPKIILYRKADLDRWLSDRVCQSTADRTTADKTMAAFP